MATSGKGTAEAAAKQSAKIAGRLETEARPGRELALAQLFDVLRTGGTTALIPTLTRGAEQTKATLSRELGGLEQGLAIGGVTGPQQQDILGRARIQAALGESAAEEERYQRFIAMLLPLIGANLQGTISGFGQAGQIGLGLGELDLGMLQAIMAPLTGAAQGAGYKLAGG